MLALLSAPAAAAGAAAGRILAGQFRLSAAVAAPLDRGWLRGKAGASSQLLAVLRTANSGFRGRSETRGGAIQLLADELDNDAADELGDGAAQLVSDERLERLRRHCHAPESTTAPAWRCPGNQTTSSPEPRAVGARSSGQRIGRATAGAALVELAVSCRYAKRLRLWPGLLMRPGLRLPGLRLLVT